MRSALDLLLDMGHERGLKQAAQMAADLLRDMLLRQLRARFGEPDPDHVLRLRAASTAELQGFGERLATAARLADVFPD